MDIISAHYLINPLGSRKIIERTTTYKSKVTTYKASENRSHPLDALRRKQQLKTGSSKDLASCSSSKIKIKPELKPSQSSGAARQKDYKEDRPSAVHNKQRKPWKKQGDTDNVGSDVELNTERPVATRPVVTGNSTSIRFTKHEVQSNIDGYSQSDIWEAESEGYLGNSKRLLNRFRKNPEPEYGK